MLPELLTFVEKGEMAGLTFSTSQRGSVFHIFAE